MAAISEQKLFSLIGSFYEAAQQASAEAWRAVYLEMAKVFRSGPGGFACYDKVNDRFYNAISTLEPELLALYIENYQHLSAFSKQIAKLKVGDRYNRAEQLSDDEFRAGPIYRSFYVPAGIFHLEYQVFLVRPGMHGGVSFTRPEGQPNFNSDELAAMAVLLPHLERAFQIYISMADTCLENRVLAEAFDHVPRNVIIVDPQLCVAFANSGARHLLAASDGLGLRDDQRLTASSARQEKKIRDAIEKVFARERRQTEVLLIPRPSGQRPLEMLISPFASHQLRSISREPLALLFVSDPEQTLEPAEAVLRRMYGLTPAEARMAALLADGNDLAEACDVLGIQASTGRTHLKRIFAKTETNRQGELLRLIINGPANIHFNPQK